MLVVILLNGFLGASLHTLTIHHLKLDTALSFTSSTIVLILLGAAAGSV
jgi:hypothetical protein